MTPYLAFALEATVIGVRLENSLTMEESILIIVPEIKEFE
jgi:hypothetical protein